MTDGRDPRDTASLALTRSEITAAIRRRVSDYAMSIKEAAEAAGMDVKRIRRLVQDGDARGLTIERMDKVIEALDDAAGER